MCDAAFLVWCLGISHAQREIILLKGIHRSFVLVARKNDIFKVSQNDRRFVWKKDCKNELLNG